jgi:hypothetical protein
MKQVEIDVMKLVGREGPFKMRRGRTLYSMQCTVQGSIRQRPTEMFSMCEIYTLID